jgi:hypothetical protein
MRAGPAGAGEFWLRHTIHFILSDAGAAGVLRYAALSDAPSDLPSVHFGGMDRRFDRFDPGASTRSAA